MSDSGQFERYRIEPIRLRLIPGVDLFSLWGYDPTGSGADALLARGDHILLFGSLRGLEDFVVSGKGHAMAQWSSFASLRSDTMKGRLSLRKSNPFTYDFPDAMETLAALTPGFHLSAASLDNLLNTLNLLWDATALWPDLGLRKLLGNGTALGRLADALTFRDATTSRLLWKKRVPRVRMGKELVFLFGAVVAHCEAVDPKLLTGSTARSSRRPGPKVRKRTTARPTQAR